MTTGRTRTHELTLTSRPLRFTADHIGNVRQAYVCEWSTCPRKGKTQTSRFALVSHFRSHSGEKPFHCPEARESSPVMSIMTPTAH
jgi:uncharacterized Zn-finger protein